MADQQQEICKTFIDYSKVVDDVILPFEFELDTAASNLNPAPGENQRFCYNITAVGADAPVYKDLSHFVFGICNLIPESQIKNITVIKDGVPQTVVFGSGGNVELFIPPKTDPPTGCSGLKFDFGLNKITGKMTVCYELTETYPIGPNAVCLFGGNASVGGLSICGPVCSNGETCEAIGFQPATVCVPVTVTPFVKKGIPVTFCCKAPRIQPGIQVCPGMENGSCSFTMSQDICVAVPVQFGANTKVGNPSVVCGDATEKDICTDCNKPSSAAISNATSTASGTCSSCQKK